MLSTEINRHIFIIWLKGKDLNTKVQTEVKDVEDENVEKRGQRWNKRRRWWWRLCIGRRGRGVIIAKDRLDLTFLSGGTYGI